MLVANTFRMGGHATHDEREARATFAAELFQEWGRRDPIGLFEEHLVSLGITREELEKTESDAERETERAEEEALSSRELLPDPASALQGVYARDPVR
jgi:TPP-dependent pyruvate/acetoin dehydrogenase alpha subunit